MADFMERTIYGRFYGKKLFSIYGRFYGKMPFTADFMDEIL